ncbi:hypothetical protein SteCoe_34150 [Stentor coeruleus]|uniref:Acyltransferase 3 domain-containing protein n=1 Tax=Stentor coeruleus TaxID=5963 RepID=A0A1R2AVJ2_9CILI|nr:hypothetical protein SteCoe_34150 [Stentor coeruleus]
MWFLLVITISASNPCWDALEDEGRSILQLIIKDYSDIKSKTTSALQLMYSGKDINDLGHYSSCIDLANSTYFLVDFKISTIPTTTGLCLPSQCTSENIKELLLTYKDKGKKLLSFSPDIYDKIEVFEPKTYALGTGGILWIIFTILLSICIILGTYFEYNQIENLKPKEQIIELEEKNEGKSSEIMQPPRRLPGYAKIMMAFSLIKNWNSLFDKGADDTTRIFNGVRAMSVGWVILGHIYLTRLTGVTYNIEDILHVFKSPISAIGYSSAMTVDAFFWLGGFLLGYLSLNEAEYNHGKIAWRRRILSRVLRILPVYIFIMCFANLVEPSIGGGPLWHLLDEFNIIGCPNYWYSNFLFLNNVIPDWKGNDCIAQSWYLAADMQLFLFSILIVILYIKFPKKYTWIVIFALLVESFVSKLIIVTENNILLCMFNSDQNFDKYRKIYTKPYTRLDSYVLGLACGFIFYQKKANKVIDPVVGYVHWFLSSKIRAYGMFLLGVGLVNVVVWVPSGPFSDYDGDFVYYSKEANYFFLAIFKLFTGLAYSFLFLPMLFDMIPIAQKILSFDLWIPIAKASFSIYMIHLCIMKGFLASESYGFYITQLNLFTDFMFNATMEIPLGILLYLTIEAPFANITKAALAPRKKSNEKSEPLITELKSSIQV